jgi:hypothetical protein
LAIANFERAKTAADRIHPTDARVHTYLTIAQETIEIVRKADQIRTSHSRPTRSTLETSLR